MQAARESSRQTQCANKVKQIALAVTSAEGAQGYYPPMAVNADGWGAGMGTAISVSGPYQGAVGFTLFTFLLPYIEQEPLYRQSNGNVNTVIGGKTVYEYPISTYVCPDEPVATPNGLSVSQLANCSTWAYGNYGGNFLVFGCPSKKSIEGQTSSAHIRDGLSNTIFLTEHYGVCGNTGQVNAAYCYPWCDSNSYFRPTFCMNGPTPPSQPYQKCLPFQVSPDWVSQCDPWRASSPHPTTIRVGLGDGSVRAVNGSINPDLWANLCDPRDGAAVTGDW